MKSKLKCLHKDHPRLKPTKCPPLKKLGYQKNVIGKNIGVVKNNIKLTKNIKKNYDQHINFSIIFCFNKYSINYIYLCFANDYPLLLITKYHPRPNHFSSTHNISISWKAHPLNPFLIIAEINLYQQLAIITALIRNLFFKINRLIFENVQ